MKRNMPYWFFIGQAIVVVAAVAIMATVTMSLSPNSASAAPLAAPASPASVEGAWYYDAIGATFAGHVIEFGADGTLVSSNPDRGEPTNSASSGIGVWEAVHGSHKTAYRGRFVEVNADVVTHQHTSNLIVDFTITVTGDRFTGTAQASVYNPNGTLAAGPFPATLKGQRITLTSLPPIAAL